MQFDWKALHWQRAWLSTLTVEFHVPHKLIQHFHTPAQVFHFEHVFSGDFIRFQL